MSDRTAAERQRRFRDRRRHGILMRASLDITQPIIDFMLGEGWIGDADLKDAGVIEGALADMVECFTEGRLVARYALRAGQSSREE